jgi:hypothetical protein
MSSILKLSEKVSIYKALYLNEMNFSEFKKLSDRYNNNDERKEYFDKLKKYTQDLVSNCGVVEREYYYSKYMKTSGRLFSNGIQNVAREIRGFFFGETTTDFDMKNAHPVILSMICKKHNIPSPYLNEYISKRDEILNSFTSMSREDSKKVFLKSVNNDKVNRQQRDPFFRRFDAEMKSLHKIITVLDEYREICDSVPVEKDYNVSGSKINRILCKYENDILQVALTIFREKDMEVCAPMFDGCMVYGNHYDNLELLKYIADKCNIEFPNLNIEWDYKTHDNSITIPEGWKSDTLVTAVAVNTKDELKQKNDNQFETDSKEFELTHTKIINNSIYVKQLDDRVLIMSKKQLIDSYEHISCGVNDKGTPISFIQKWTYCNDKISKKDCMQIYPNPSQCPENVYNLWRPFAMELLKTPYEKDIVGLEIMLKHIYILCNNEKASYDYLIGWIAMMIQHPEVKTTCVTLISLEGAGKGTLMESFSNMMGASKVLETKDPSRDVWGQFNGAMTDAFLVNLNEMEMTDTKQAEGKIKALITDSQMTINLKGVNQFQIESCHHFIVTTNKENGGMTTKKDDRRKLIIRSSDELIGNKKYFDNTRT